MLLAVLLAGNFFELEDACWVVHLKDCQGDFRKNQEVVFFWDVKGINGVFEGDFLIEDRLGFNRVLPVAIAIEELMTNDKYFPFLI